MKKRVLTSVACLLVLPLLASCADGKEPSDTDTVSSSETVDTVTDMADNTADGTIDDPAEDSAAVTSPDTADETAGDVAGETTDETTDDATADTEGSVPSASDYGHMKEPPVLAEDAIHVVDAWGIQAGEGHAKENSLLLLQKFAEMPDGSTVYFPAGEYELAFPMLIQGKKNIRVVGYNTILVRTGTINTSALQPPMEAPEIPADLRAATGMTSILCALNVEGLVVEGLQFQYDTPTSLSGKVVSVSGSTVTIEITDGSEITGGEYVTVINTFDENKNPDRTFEQYASENFPCEKIDEKTVKVSGLDIGGASRLKPDMNICLRLCSGRDYVMTLSGVKDLVARDLTMDRSYNGGMLFVDRCENATIENLAIKPQNEKTLMTLNADAIHIADMVGRLTVDGCYFERQGDDSLNVHSMACIVGERSQDTLTLTAPRTALSAAWGRVGDTLVFYHPTTFERIGEGTISHISGDRFTFESLPASIQTGMIASNRSLSPEVLVGHCVVKSTRARGFLLQTDKAQVIGCTFYHTALAAILIAPDIDEWYEMSPVEDVLLEGNTFVECGRYAKAAVEVAPSHAGDNETYHTYLHQKIVLDRNRFVGGTMALSASCVKQIRFVQNVIEGIEARPLIKIRMCKEARIQGGLDDLVHATDTNILSFIDQPKGA